MKKYESSNKRIQYYHSKKYKDNLKQYRERKEYKQYQKEYHSTEEIKEYNKLFLRKYRKTKRFKTWNRKWNQTPKGKANALKQHLKRRAIKNNIVEVYTEEQWNKKLQLTNGICPRCKKRVGIKNIHRDHIYSISLANQDYIRTGIKRIYTIDDMQPLCKSCNSSKSNKQIITYPIINDSKSNMLEVVN